ncbi:MAG: hypothetical protein IT365_28185 [Candidatus Hydrogenedentes bacterium]|nr:hypothetical protein [Candidatus Hydrogenedentota bacterium]
MVDRERHHFRRDPAFVRWKTDGSTPPNWIDGDPERPVGIKAVAIAPNGRSIIADAAGLAAVWETSKRVGCVVNVRIPSLMVATRGSHGPMAAYESWTNAPSVWSGAATV